VDKVLKLLEKSRKSYENLNCGSTTNLDKSNRAQ